MKKKSYSTVCPQAFDKVSETGDKERRSVCFVFSFAECCLKIAVKVVGSDKSRLTVEIHGSALIANPCRADRSTIIKTH